MTFRAKLRAVVKVRSRVRGKRGLEFQNSDQNSDQSGLPVNPGLPVKTQTNKTNDEGFSHL